MKVINQNSNMVTFHCGLCGRTSSTGPCKCYKETEPMANIVLASMDVLRSAFIGDQNFIQCLNGSETSTLKLRQALVVLKDAFQEFPEKENTMSNSDDGMYRYRWSTRTGWHTNFFKVKDGVIQDDPAHVTSPIKPFEGRKIEELRRARFEPSWKFGNDTIMKISDEISND